MSKGHVFVTGGLGFIVSSDRLLALLNLYSLWTVVNSVECPSIDMHARKELPVNRYPCSIGLYRALDMKLWNSVQEYFGGREYLQY